MPQSCPCSLIASIFDGHALIYLQVSRMRAIRCLEVHYRSKRRASLRRSGRKWPSHAIPPKRASQVCEGSASAFDPPTRCRYQENQQARVDICRGLRIFAWRSTMHRAGMYPFSVFNTHTLRIKVRLRNTSVSKTSRCTFLIYLFWLWSGRRLQFR
jgi:hypothetical protein